MLMAGAFATSPVRVHAYPGGRFAFLDADGVNCWSDPNHRVLLYDIKDVKLVLDAHSYDLDLATMAVSRRTSKGTAA